MKNYVPAAVALLIAANAFAADAGFRFDNVSMTCKNSSGQQGVNPDYVGQCGAISNATIVSVANAAFPNATIMNLAGQDLRGAVFSDSTIHLSSLARSNLTGTKFENVLFDNTSSVGTDFTGATFDEVRTLGNTSFAGATLVKSTFTRSDLSNGRFDNANLSSAAIDSANGVASLIGADLRGADLRALPRFLSMRVQGAKFNASTQLPGGVTQDSLVARGMTFTGAN